MNRLFRSRRGSEAETSFGLWAAVVERSFLGRLYEKHLNTSISLNPHSGFFEADPSHAVGPSTQRLLWLVFYWKGNWNLGVVKCLAQDDGADKREGQDSNSSPGVKQYFPKLCFFCCFLFYYTQYKALPGKARRGSSDPLLLAGLWVFYAQELWHRKMDGQWDQTKLLLTSESGHKVTTQGHGLLWLSLRGLKLPWSQLEVVASLLGHVFLVWNMRQT